MYSNLINQKNCENQNIIQNIKGNSNQENYSNSTKIFNYLKENIRKLHKNHFLNDYDNIDESKKGKIIKDNQLLVPDLNKTCFFTIDQTIRDKLDQNTYANSKNIQINKGKERNINQDLSKLNQANNSNYSNFFNNIPINVNKKYEFHHNYLKFHQNLYEKIKYSNLNQNKILKD